ncbi:unnamed protein product, partial [Tilletia laevis]
MTAVLSTPPTFAKGPQVFINLEQRVFDAFPEIFELNETEIDAFLKEENTYTTFLKPANSNASHRRAPKSVTTRLGDRRLFRATFISRCSCSGHYRERKDPNVSPQKRRATGGSQTSNKLKCAAYIKITVKAPLIDASDPAVLAAAGADNADADVAATLFQPSSLPGPAREDSIVKVEYYWRHTNHEPGTLAGLARQRNCQSVRQWIENQVRQGHTVSEIMRATRMSLQQLRSIVHSTSTIDASIRIRYDDIYNVVRRLKVERARKDVDGH